MGFGAVVVVNGFGKEVVTISELEGRYCVFVAERGATFVVECPRHDVIEAFPQLEEAARGEEKTLPDLSIFLEVVNNFGRVWGGMKPSYKAVRGTGIVVNEHRSLVDVVVGLRRVAEGDASGETVLCFEENRR